MRPALTRLLLCLTAMAAVSAPALVAPAAAEEAASCPSNKAPPLILPHVRDAIARNQDVTIVAIGSSSTQGWHSTDIAHSYPAILQRTLNTLVPTAHFAVINRGIGGQDVSEELPRLESDALSVRPTLVIWQVGANGAMKHIAPELFRRLLNGGVRRLMEAKVDVVLMDNQRAAAILAAPQHVQFDQAMVDVASNNAAGLFGRGVLMDQWRVSGYPYELFMSDDGVHHNDYGYRCVANALATSIVEGLARPAPSHDVAKR